MATNKNQHFVPRVHLRPFTVDEGGAAINVFNLDREKLIPNAPVKKINALGTTSMAGTKSSNQLFKLLREHMAPFSVT
jgi:hypothetical protein